jgi:PadR family transcriptional regulator, regulatory protein AphA
MERKPIRLSTTSYAVMSLLDVLGEATPYDLKQTLDHSIENFWHVPHTTFYDEPVRLAEAGYLSERQEPGGRRRKVYSLTDSGRTALREWADTPGAPPSQYRDEGMLKVFAGADPHQAFAGRAEWHRSKLAEFEGYLAALRALETPADHERLSGPEATLLGGMEYHRQMRAIFERLLGEDNGDDGAR